ncbi:MAG TPA: protease modulator HflC, partial [Gemmataceae bacterium]|nr:protease modulator HflC [Gemmataceae bacterium]
MRILLLAGAVLLGLLGLSSLYTVDRGEFAYVTQFGQFVAVHDGATDGGLHVKSPWPVQSVQRLDRRLQYFDLPETELLTHDAEGQTIDKTLTVVAYVCWRIAGPDSVDLFIRRLGTPERARAVLGERVRGQLGALIGQMRMDDLISVEPQRVDRSLEDLRHRLLDEAAADRAGGSAASLRQRAHDEYGIELVDIRLRRTSHPQAVQDAIFDRIRSERQKKVADYQSEGARLAADIRSDAERQARETLAGAKAEEQRIKGEAEVEADRIRNQAHAKDPEFYAFLKKLEEYQRILGDNKTLLLLSAHRELFDLLFQPPRPGTSPKPVAEAPAKPADK